MRIKVFFSALVCLMMLASASGVAGAAAPTYVRYNRETYDYFATVCALSLYTEDAGALGKAHFEQTWAQVRALMGEIEQAVSVSVPESDIARFNRLRYGQSLSISPHTAAILRIAKQVHAQTGGLYDPTVYPLVDLWGFSPRFNAVTYLPECAYDRSYRDGQLPLPEKKYIEALHALVNLDGVVLTREAAGGVRMTKNIWPVRLDGVTYEAKIDLGGIAKGYAADRVIERLREAGYRYGHFVCGGSSMAMLKCASPKSVENGTYAYALGVRKPRAGRNKDSSFVKVSVSDVTLSSSGDYSHGYVQGGVRYCHIIDPRTGYPINVPDGGLPDGSVQAGIAAITLSSPDATYNDAMSTALCVMGG
ncbi:MAG: FAD:protein FMN transferase, partial [Clostridia bacterium]